MAYVIEMSPVVIQEIQDYERATGQSLEACIVEFVKNELRRRREADEWEARFDSLVESSSSRLSGTDAYKFNRADAYPDGEFA
jgi:hypothetical protein